MPVTKSAKKALRVSHRRHAENVIQKDAFKKAIKEVKKAVSTGSEEVAKLLSVAQSALDRAAKKNTIHPNKAARLKSRLSKKLTPESVIPTVKKKAVRKSTTKSTKTSKKS